MRLQINKLQVAYGSRTVLRDIDLTLESGEVLTLCGRAGSGRSTLLKAVMGLVPVVSGTIIVEDESGIHNFAAESVFQRVRQGIVWVPETKELFAGLAAEENLLLALKASGLFSQNEWQVALQAIYGRYPILQTRAKVAASVLSGGEQQLLAFARAALIASKAQLLLLDEPAEGLAQNWVKQVEEHLKELKNAGKAILLVEQKMQISQMLGAKEFYL